MFEYLFEYRSKRVLILNEFQFLLITLYVRIIRGDVRKSIYFTLERDNVFKCKPTKRYYDDNFRRTIMLFSAEFKMFVAFLRLRNHRVCFVSIPLKYLLLRHRRACVIFENYFDNSRIIIIITRIV